MDKEETDVSLVHFIRHLIRRDWDWFRLLSSLRKSLVDFYWYLRKLGEKYPEQVSEILKLLDNPNMGPCLFQLFKHLKTGKMSIEEWTSLARYVMSWLQAYLRYCQLSARQQKSPEDIMELRYLSQIVGRVPAPLSNYLSSFGWWNRQIALTLLAQQMHILEKLGEVLGIDPRELALYLYTTDYENLTMPMRFVRALLSGELNRAVTYWVNMDEQDREALLRAVPEIEQITKYATLFKIRNVYLRETETARQRTGQTTPQEIEQIRQRLLPAMPAPSPFPVTVPQQQQQQTMRTVTELAETQREMIGKKILLPTGEELGTIVRVQTNPRTGEIVQIWFRTPDGQILAIQPQFLEKQGENYILKPSRRT